MNKDFYQQACGMSKQDIQEQYIDSLTAKFSGLEMVVMGILSDCQEMGVSEQVRRQLNVAKIILSEMLDKSVKVA
jgi:hypothetical protein